MARISQGINGAFSGKVGTVVGATWNGISYMRSKPTLPKKRTYSPKQIVQRQLFAAAARFANGLTPLLDTTFRKVAVNKTGRNAAISYLIKRAVTTNGSNVQLDYAQVLISRGDLLGAAEATAVVDTEGTIHFHWTDNSNTRSARASDKAIVVVHCPALNKNVYAISEATRSSGTASIEASAFKGHTAHTWLGFMAKNGKEVADSVYTGAVVA